MTNLNVNDCRFAGRLVADPELRMTSKDIPYVQFSLAVNEYTKPGEERKAIFVDFTAWRGTAEYLAKHASKGDVVYVEAEYKISKYTKDNETRYNHSFVVKQGIGCLQLVGCKKFDEAAANKANGGNGSAASNKAVPTAPPVYSSDDGFNDVDDDGDLPF